MYAKTWKSAEVISLIAFVSSSPCSWSQLICDTFEFFVIVMNTTQKCEWTASADESATHDTHAADQRVDTPRLALHLQQAVGLRLLIASSVRDTP